MRITQPLSFVAKQMAKTIAKKTVLVSFGFTLLASGVIASQNLLTTPDSANAATPPDSCFAFNAGTGTITDYYNNEANNAANPACPRAVDIPATIGGVPVVSIGTVGGGYPGPFTGKSLTSVTIPEGVTSIGDSAFFSNKLTSVTIPSSVTSIGDSAFFSNKLTSVTIPSSVTSIGSNAFRSNQLTSVTIPEGVTSIGIGAFSSNRLTTVTIPDGITSIGSQAFSSNQLTTVTIPGGVTSIGGGAFSSNQLTTVTILNPAASMQHSSFAENPISSMTIGSTTYTEQTPTTNPACFAISGTTVTDYYRLSPIVARNSGILCGKDVIIPDGVTSIGNNAFYFDQLTSVSIPSSVTSLGWSAFYGNKLTSATLSEGLQSIDGYAFQNNMLTSVIIPSTVTSIHPAAFALQTPWGEEIWGTSNPDVPLLWSADSAEVQRLFDNIWYVRLYTADPTNPHNLTDGILSEKFEMGEDANGNGTQYDSLGGHLVNPSSTELRSLDRSGTAIDTSQTITGMLNGSPLTNYLVTQGPLVPNIANSSSPTPAEQAALDQAFSAYHRAGSTQTFTPQAISGYVTPAPQAKTLVAGDNTLDFTYNRPVLSVPFVSNDVTDGVLVPSTTPGSVASPLLSESKLSIANDNTCSTIQSAELLAPGSVSAPQGITMLGGLGFTLDCTTAATTTVSLTLGSQANPDTLRVYKDIAGTLTDITSQVTFTTNNGKTVLTYTLTDGGAFDEDDTANGTIVDPIYIGVAGSGELASTGINATMVVAVGVVTLAAGIAFAMRRDVVRAPIRTRQ